MMDTSEENMEEERRDAKIRTDIITYQLNLHVRIY